MWRCPVFQSRVVEPQRGGGVGRGSHILPHPAAMSRSRPTSARRKSSAASAVGENLEYECKAAYLVIADDIDEALTSKNQLRNGTSSHLLLWWYTSLMYSSLKTWVLSHHLIPTKRKKLISLVVSLPCKHKMKFSCYLQGLTLSFWKW